MVTISDKILKASSGTRPNPTTLTANKGIGDALLNADDLTGWATDTPITFVLFKVDTSGNEIVDTRTDWKGIVSGNTITQLVLTAGVDTIYPSGSPVIAAATARWADDLATALLVSHNPNGTLKDGIVGEATLGDGSVTNAKLSSQAWQSWTPTWANFTLGNGSAVYGYTQIGKVVHFRVFVTFGSTSSFSTSPTFTLPVAARASVYSLTSHVIGSANYLDAGVADYIGAVRVDTTTVAQILAVNAGGANANLAAVTPTTPFAWATGDMFSVAGTYETP